MEKVAQEGKKMSRAHARYGHDALVQIHSFKQGLLSSLLLGRDHTRTDMCGVGRKWGEMVD